jgi:hypothetical protein
MVPQRQPAAEDEPVGERFKIGGCDEHAESVADLDDAKGLENLERFPKRVPPHPKGNTQLILGGQGISDFQIAIQDQFHNV